MDTCLCALQLMVYYRFLPATLAVDASAHEDDGVPAAAQQVRRSTDVTIGVSRRK